MIKIDSNFSIKLEDNSLYKNIGRKRELILKVGTQQQLVKFVGKQMLLKDNTDSTLSITEYEQMYLDNIDLIMNKIKEHNETL